MSDISASDTGSESGAPVSGGEAVEAADFDLDAAVEEFATTAPDEWKTKASKIQSELKNLRGKYAPLRDRFEGVHEGDRDALFSLVDMIKSGDKDGAVKWAIEAAKGLSGESWGDVVKELTPSEQAELKEDIADAKAEGATPEDIQKMIQEALEADRNTQKEALAAQERQQKINNDFQTLGYNVERDKNGRLTDFTTQQVAMLAINDHGGDIQAAHEAYEKWMGNAAKAYLQKHQGNGSLLADGGTPVKPDETANLTPAQKAQARINRLAEGPAA